jgi:hypothetical protein
MAVKFETTEYEGTHGQMPKGTGGWIFTFKRMTGERVELKPRGPLTLTEAKKKVREMIRLNWRKELNDQYGTITLQVAP